MLRIQTAGSIQETNLLIPNLQGRVVPPLQIQWVYLLKILPQGLAPFILYFWWQERQTRLPALGSSAINSMGPPTPISAVVEAPPPLARDIAES